MKRLIALALTLSLASCDSSTKAADGTSSETQSSLQALADRLPMLPRQFVAAARGMAMARPEALAGVRDSSFWTTYTASPGGPVVARVGSQIVRHDPAADSWSREYEERTLVFGCEIHLASVVTWNPDGTGGTTSRYWITYPNGAVLEAKDVDRYFLFDGRWSLWRSASPDRDWDVWEGGKRIGTIRVEDSGAGEFLGMSKFLVYDLAGNVVPSRVPMDTSWKREEPLGLAIVSSRRLEDGSGMVRLRWNLLPSTALSPGDSLQVYLQGPAGPGFLALASPIRTLRGEDSLLLPIAVVGGGAPSSLELFVASPLSRGSDSGAVSRTYYANAVISDPFQ